MAPELGHKPLSGCVSSTCVISALRLRIVQSYPFRCTPIPSVACGFSHAISLRGPEGQVLANSTLWLLYTTLFLERELSLQPPFRTLARVPSG